MFHFHYNCSTDLSLRALIFLCMANNCVCVWLWIIFQTTMKAETVTWYINIVLSFILGEVQWVNHRYVPHASSFGEGTSKPGHTDLQARNDGECQAHRVVVIMGKPPSFLLYHLSMLAQTVWKPSTDALSSGISWLIHDSVKHIRLLWLQASAVGSCSLFASDLTFPIILHGRLSLKLFIAWSLHFITVSLPLYLSPTSASISATERVVCNCHAAIPFLNESNSSAATRRRKTFSTHMFERKLLKTN